MRYAVVNSSTRYVENVIVLEDGALYDPGEGFVLQSNEWVDIGDYLESDGSFWRPMPTS